ncbi:MAG: hypothetical protein IJ300_14120 [Clostridia bacterium]|nr:hypothetical protein [Clostridia bacterium]
MSNVTEIKLKKTEFIPFLDTSGGATDATWKRIARSTIFSLNPSPQTESLDYISTEIPVEEVKNYIPELPQETALYEGDPIYDFMFQKFYELPVGSACVVPALICFGGTSKKAWRCNATLVLGELNTVDGKLSFTIKFGGNIDRGTYTITDGSPVFEAETASE